MPHLISRTALVAAAATLLTACATTPQYATGGMTGGGPALETPKPAYPVQQPDADPDPVPQATPSTPVESSPLSPVAGPGTVETTALPPPPVRAEPEPEPEPAYVPPPAPVMREVTRTVTLAPGKVIDADGRPKTYTVKEGQGLDAVARAMGSSRAELAKINKLKEPYALKPGQVLKGPASRAKAYVVTSGDTLFAIARRFGVTAKDLAEENDIETGSPLRVGQKIKLPPGFKDAGPTKKTITTMEPDLSATPPPAPVRPTPRPEPVRPAPVPVTPAPTPAPAPVKPAPTPLRPAPAPTTESLPPAAKPTPVKPAPAPAKPIPVPPAPKPLPPVAKPTPTPTPLPPATRPTPAPTPGKPVAPLLPDDRPPAQTDAEIAQLGRGVFQWPVRGEVISDFGPKGGGKRNDGLDIAAAAGSPVRAAASGEVVYSGGDVPGFGVTILIKHENGWVTVYGNLERTDVKMKQTVTAGQQIGTVGRSGGAPQPQLHFEVRYSPSAMFKAKAIDPALVLPR